MRARILITRAVSRLGIDGPEAALTLLDQVRELARQRSTPILEVQAHLQAGAIHVMCSNWIEALDELTHVEPHLDELVPREQTSALINRGLAAVSLQDLEGGRRDLERALDIAVRHGFGHQEFKARHNLGCVATSPALPGPARRAEAARMSTAVGLPGPLDHQGLRRRLFDGRVGLRRGPTPPPAAAARTRRPHRPRPRPCSRTPGGEGRAGHPPDLPGCGRRPAGGRAVRCGGRLGWALSPALGRGPLGTDVRCPGRSPPAPEEVPWPGPTRGARRSSPLQPPPPPRGA